MKSCEKTKKLKIYNYCIKESVWSYARKMNSESNIYSQKVVERFKEDKRYTNIVLIDSGKP